MTRLCEAGADDTLDLDDALRMLLAAQNESESHKKDKAELVEFMCHELRNPLHSTDYLLDILQEQVAASWRHPEVSFQCHEAQDIVAPEVIEGY